MKFYGEIKGCVNSAALWAMIGPNRVSITDLGEKAFISGDESPYALGWVLDRCSMFGEVCVVVPSAKLPTWTPPSNDEGA